MVVSFSGVKPFNSLAYAQRAPILPRVRVGRGVYFIDVANSRLVSVYNQSTVKPVTDLELQYYLEEGKKQAFSGVK